MNIDIAAQTVFSVGGFAVTNSLLLSVLALLFTSGFMIYVGHKITVRRQRVYGDDTDVYNQEIFHEKMVRARGGFFTRLTLWTIEALYRTVRTVIPNHKIAKHVAPFTISIFFFVIFNYYFGLLPFVGEAITLHHVPLFRGGASDLSFTFMLAILTIVMVQVYAVRALGWRTNLHRYFVNPLRDPIGAFGGLLELIGEFSRMLALSFRLFGNCFAGEVLLLVVQALTHFVSPAVLPLFYFFELFIGGIQAYVFFMLATAFISIAVGSAVPKKTPDFADSTKDDKMVESKA